MVDSSDSIIRYTVSNIIAILAMDNDKAALDYLLEGLSIILKMKRLDVIQVITIIYWLLNNQILTGESK